MVPNIFEDMLWWFHLGRGLASGLMGRSSGRLTRRLTGWMIDRPSTGSTGRGGESQRVGGEVVQYIRIVAENRTHIVR